MQYPSNQTLKPSARDQNHIKITVDDIKPQIKSSESAPDAKIANAQSAGVVQQTVPQPAQELQKEKQQTNDSPPTVHDVKISSFKLSPIARGLTLIHIQEGSVLSHVGAAMNELVITRSNVLGVDMPKVSCVESLFTGRKRSYEQACYLLNTIPRSPDVKHQFEHCLTENVLDWTSSEGRCALQPHLANEDCLLVLELNAQGKSAEEISHGIARISADAKSSNKYVMMVIAGLKAGTGCQLAQCCDEYLEVSPCENDVDADLSFSIECVGLSELGGSGIGKVMCSVIQDGNGFQRRYAPFVASDLKTRAMWELRGQGKSLEEVGQYFNVHKTSVQRRLKGLPPPCCSAAGDDWLARNLEWAQVTSSPKKGAGACHAEEVVVDAA